MKGMATGQTTNFILVGEIVDADSTGITRRIEKFRGNGCMNWILFVLVVDDFLYSLTPLDCAGRVVRRLLRHRYIEGFFRHRDRRSWERFALRM